MKFDLEERVRLWRRELLGAESFREEDVAELEAHLRDSVASLEMRGLSSEEAFWLAHRRLGKARAIAPDFETVNARSIWRNRTLWMLTGIIAFGVIRNTAQLFSFLAMTAGALASQNGIAIGWLGVVARGLVLLGCCVLAWQILRRKEPSLDRIKRNPNRWAAALFGMMVALQCAAFVAPVLVARVGGPTVVGQIYAIGNWGAVAFEFLLTAGLVVGLVRLSAPGRPQTDNIAASRW